MMMNNILSTILLFLFFISSNDSARILVKFIIPSKSHSILSHGVVDRLLEAGHEVVHITAYPKSRPVKNLREINVGFLREKLLKGEQNEKYKLQNLIKSDTSTSLSFLLIPYTFQKMVLEINEVQELLSDPNEKFDAIVQEWFFYDATAGLGPLLNAHFIWLVPTGLHWQPLRVIDDIQNPSYMVDVFSSSKYPLSFSERVHELWTLIKRGVFVEVVLSSLEKYTIYTMLQDLAIKRGVTLPSYSDAIYNSTLMLINSHPSIGKPHRLPQNAKYIAGYHIADKVEPLPKDLKKLMDDSKSGVVYFSMGSNLKSEDMTMEMKESLLNVFGKLKQTVIWKYEDDNLKNIPSNVFLMKWAPQPGILDHPNLKFFITHGGQLSTTEAIHYGVPVIGLPVMADQFINMNTIVQNGYGIKVQIDDDLAIKLNIAIQEMLSNPSYTKKAREISAIYHDRPITPGKEMVFWIEHVIRTGGAPHLRSPAMALSWYQKLYLDLAALVIIIVSIMYKLFKKMYSIACCQKKTVSQDRKVKKK